MKYDTYLFDFDYTLANSERGIVKCFKLLFAAEGYPINPDEEIRRTIGMSMIEALRVLTGVQDEKLLWELRYKYTYYADKYMTENTFVYPQTRPVLARIHAEGKKTAIISNKTRRRIMQTLTRDDLAQFVDFIVGSEDVQSFKPSPEGLTAGLNALGISRDKAVYIGDNVIDAQTAQNAQVDFAAVLTGNNSAEDFQNLPHVQIMENLSQLQ